MNVLDESVSVCREPLCKHMVSWYGCHVKQLSLQMTTIWATSVSLFIHRRGGVLPEGIQHRRGWVRESTQSSQASIGASLATWDLTGIGLHTTLLLTNAFVYLAALPVVQDTHAPLQTMNLKIPAPYPPPTLRYMYFSLPIVEVSPSLTAIEGRQFLLKNIISVSEKEISQEGQSGGNHFGVHAQWGKLWTQSEHSGGFLYSQSYACAYPGAHRTKIGRTMRRGTSSRRKKSHQSK